MTHAGRGKVADLTLLHFILGPKRAVEQKYFTVRQRFDKLFVQSSDVGKKKQAATRSFVDDALTEDIASLKDTPFDEPGPVRLDRQRMIDQTACGASPDPSCSGARLPANHTVAMPFRHSAPRCRPK